ncbi:hypothetical protein D9613_004062 [Agrocybe pediades]|uniref:Uncharacterized protein n=1 Tax=Agrocybe pediades TaxID=84607 RepID=A0A8H4VJA4_9AGAR|nr:hypothetical protein D9613_004062 [Agrocybe pediades]
MGDSVQAKKKREKPQPKDVDYLSNLGKDTEQLLQALESICKEKTSLSRPLEQKKGASTQITHDALQVQYIQAINDGVVAAQFCYDISEEALKLLRDLKERREMHKDTWKLGDMLIKQAVLLHLKEDRGKEIFEKVQVPIDKLRAFEEAKLMLARRDNGAFLYLRNVIGTETAVDQDGIRNISKSMRVLDKLTDNARFYLSWWTWMRSWTSPLGIMAGTDHDSKSNKLSEHWTNINKLCLQYTTLVKKLDIGQPEDSRHAKVGFARRYGSKQGEAKSPKPIERPALLRVGNSILISQPSEQTTESSISVKLSMVQILPKGLCFLRLDIQSIGSVTHRVDSMTVRWHFSKATGAPESAEDPRVIDIAPKQSTGAKNEEFRERVINAEVPVQVKFGAVVTAGPKLSGQVTTKTKLERATVLTGIIGGHGQQVEWRAKENRSLKSGIPAHFCLAVVLKYSSTIVMKVQVDATQRTGKFLFDFSGPVIKAEAAFEVDVGTLRREYKPTQPSEEWEVWFPKITGDVEGANLERVQAPLYRP